MPAGDVPKLVGDHALNFIGRIGSVDQTGMQIDHLSAGHEGVDGRVVHQHDVDIAGFEAGCLHQRGRHLAHQRLGLCVAQDRLGECGLGGEGDQRAKRQHVG